MTNEPKDRDIREQLNDLWKTTVDQFDEIKDVIIRHSHVGRKKLDTAFLRRQRDRLFQDLGEAIFNQVEAGTLELAPEGHRIVERIRDVLRQIEEEGDEISRIHAGEIPQPRRSTEEEPTVIEMPAVRVDEFGEPVMTIADPEPPAAMRQERAVDEPAPSSDKEEAAPAEDKPKPRRKSRAPRRRKPAKAADGDKEADKE